MARDVSHSGNTNSTHGHTQCRVRAGNDPALFTFMPKNLVPGYLNRLIDLLLRRHFSLCISETDRLQSHSCVLSNWEVNYKKKKRESEMERKRRRRRRLHVACRPGRSRRDDPDCLESLTGETSSLSSCCTLHLRVNVSFCHKHSRIRSISPSISLSIYIFF